MPVNRVPITPDARPAPAGSTALSQHYLELLKKTLTFSYWNEPGIPIDEVLAGFGFPARFLSKSAQALLSPLRMKLTYLRPGQSAREDGQIWPAHAFTMVGMKRLNQLQEAVETVLREGISGDFVETGVWRGGASIFMRCALLAHGETHRKVWVCDSFEGLPKPDPENYPADRGDIHHKLKTDAVSLEEVQANFRHFGVLDSQVVFLKGWFKDTLPTAKVEKIAILRLDGDMYESTIQALEALYDKLSPGGYCIIDDYGLKNCQKAVEDFRTKHSIRAPITHIDWTGVYWRKD